MTGGSALPHGLCKSKNATRMLVLLEPIEPAADVVRFEQTVGGKLAATGPMRASVGHKNAEAVPHEQFRIADHAQAVVAEAV
jgi:hypothetical protein